MTPPPAAGHPVATAAIPDRTPAALVGALVASAFLAAFGALHYGFFTRKLLLDTPIYERYGDAMVHRGEVPYRDFAVEYPPGALPVFAAPSLAASEGDFGRYSRLFEVLMLLCGAAAAAIVGFVLSAQKAGLARLVSGTLLAGLAPLALGPVVLSRFDLWPAALTIAALAALVTGRDRLAFAVLGVAVAAKLYPAVLVPLAVTFVWRRRGRRDAALCTAILVAAALVCFLPFLAVAPGGVWSSLSGQASRPLQIETLGASFLLAAHQLWGLSLTQVSSHGSDNLVGGVPHALALAQSLIGVAAVVAIWAAFARGEASRDRLLRYVAAAICAFVALGKVLSPQYLVWLMALVPLVRGRRGVVAAALFVAAMVTTQLWFPYRYVDLVYGLDAKASWLVLARDLTLVALLATLLVPERAPRLGRVVVAGLVAPAAAALVAAAAVGSGSGATTHRGLLDETGVASSCALPKPVPARSPGTIQYDLYPFVNAAGARRCVAVRVTAAGEGQVFSAAYRPAFDSADPRVNYSGDAGRCTNSVEAPAGTLRYAFAAPARARFAVEVEACRGAGVSRHTLEVSAGVNAPAFRSASATRQGGNVAVRWRTMGRGRATRFDVYREQGGVRQRANGRPLRDLSRFDDGFAPEGSLHYWIRATRAGAWTWYGPIRVG